MSEKYLIGVDGSEQSRVALAWGLARATERGASVELIHVADDSFLAESVAFLSEAQAASEQMLQAETEQAAPSASPPPTPPTSPPRPTP